MSNGCNPVPGSLTGPPEEPQAPLGRLCRPKGAWQARYRKGVLPIMRLELQRTIGLWFWVGLALLGWGWAPYPAWCDETPSAFFVEDGLTDESDESSPSEDSVDTPSGPIDQAFSPDLRAEIGRAHV